MADAKKAAFRAVARDEIAALADLLNSPTEEWSKWTNQAGQTLLALCKERGSFQSYALLAKAIGVGTDSGKVSKEEPSARAFRAAAQDDMAALAEILGGLSVQTWLRWRNKAGKDLLTMSLERRKLGAHAVLRKALASPLPVVQVMQPVASAGTVAEAEEPTAAVEAQQTPTPEAEQPPAAPGKAEESPPVQPDSAEEKEARKKSAEEARARAEERRAQEKLDSEKKALAKSELDAKIARQAKKVEEDESLKASEQAEQAARQAQEEASKKAEEDARKTAEEQKAAEEQANKKAEEDAKHAEEEAKQRAEEEAKQKAEEEAKRKAEEEEAKKKAEEDAKKKAEEEATRKKAEEEAKVKAEKAAEEARKKAEEEARNRPPPTIGGDLKKKGKGGMFRKAWDQRHIVVQDNKLSWYKQKSDVGKMAPQCVVDFRATACEMVADPANATYMILRPKTGDWVGQDFKGADDGREFVFDTAGSEHSLESWLKATNLHCEFALKRRKTQSGT